MVSRGSLLRQLRPDGSVAEQPSASFCTGSYNFCRFATLRADEAEAAERVAVAGADPAHLELRDLATGAPRPGLPATAP